MINGAMYAAEFEALPPCAAAILSTADFLLLSFLLLFQFLKLPQLFKLQHQ